MKIGCRSRRGRRGDCCAKRPRRRGSPARHCWWPCLCIGRACARPHGRRNSRTRPRDAPGISARSRRITGPAAFSTGIFFTVIYGRPRLRILASGTAGYGKSYRIRTVIDMDGAQLNQDRGAGRLRNLSAANSSACRNSPWRCKSRSGPAARKNARAPACTGQMGCHAMAA
jgi:hypothetical protein